MEEAKQIISIDVGIKHCSYCLFNISTSLPTLTTTTTTTPSYTISDWNVVSLAQSKPTCSHCPRVAVYQKGKTFDPNEPLFCKTHAKSESGVYALPTKLTKEQQEQSVEQLANFATDICKLSAETIAPLRKTALIKLLRQHLQTNALFPISKTITTQSLSHKLQHIAHSIVSTFDAIHQRNLMPRLTTVLIENQIGPIASKMQTIQGMLTQYFIVRFPNVKVDFVSAQNKLKHLDATISAELSEQQPPRQSKKAYQKRKTDGIAECKNILETHSDPWLPFFLSHKKKDDLSDSFLQGLWFITTQHQHII